MLVQVFKYKVYDINTDGYKLQENYATADFIKNIKGAVALKESMLEVDVKLLDGNGKYLKKN